LTENFILYAVYLPIAFSSRTRKFKCDFLSIVHIRGASGAAKRGSGTASRRTTADADLYSIQPKMQNYKRAYKKMFSRKLEIGTKN